MRLGRAFPAFCWTVAGLTGTGLPSAWAAKAEPTVKVVRGAVAEDRDRLVDQAAITAQQESIRRLVKLLQRYRGTSHEPVLLSKLAELYQQEGSLRFRVAHGKANKKNSAIDMTQYKGTMRQSVGTLNDLITRYPDFDDIDLAYFMRAKAHQEIGDKPSAKRDYLTLVQKFPAAPEAVSAFMALADYAIQDEKHAEALGYLSEVEKRPETAQYPFALYKMAWAHNNLRNIPKGLSYLERHIAYYKKAAGGAEGDVNSTSDESLRENSLMDLAMFYFEAIEKKVSGYEVEDALDYFHKQDPGDKLGRMTIRFAKHLRAAGMGAHLNTWKNHLIKHEVTRPETIEVVMILFEDQINKRRLDLMGNTAKDFVRICRAAPKVKTFEAYFKAQKMLLETAEKIQALTIKNKKSDDVKNLTSTLSSLYTAFIEIVNSKDERVPKVHYNLAETLFEIQDYEGATQHYRWVVENWKNQKAFDLKTPSIKAISSRYEVLRLKKLIPTALTPKALGSDKGEADPLLEEWVSWIDKHGTLYRQTDEVLDNFRFEAARALYAQGRIKTAVDRLLAFSEAHPASKFAIPGASLVLDTYVAGTDWEKTNEMSIRLLKVRTWDKTPFGERLFAMAADSFYKIAETQHKGGDHKHTLQKSEECVQNYSKSERLVDCLLLAGKSALGLQQEEKAEAYFTRLIDHHSGSHPSVVALLERAQIREKNFQFVDAARDFRRYMATEAAKKLGEDRASDIWTRTLQLFWYGGATQDVLVLVKTLGQCRSDLLELCTRLEAFSYLRQPGSDSFKEAITRTLHGKKDQRALWAMVGLKNVDKAPYKDRLLLAKAVADNWDRLDAISQYALLPELSESFTRAIDLARRQIPALSPLKATPRAIKRRVEFIQELEGVATAGIKLPWARLRTELLNQVADLYSEFAISVRNLPAPSGLPDAERAEYDESIQKIVFPFEEKGSDIRRKAFEVASTFGVEDQTLDRVASLFFKENPSQAKALEIEARLRRPVAFDIELMTRLSKFGYWSRVRSVKVDKIRVTPENRSRALQSLWFHHVDQKNWPAVAYFLAETQRVKDKTLPQTVVTVMKAYSLAAAGARAEAFAELYEERGQFEGAERGTLAGTLIALHVSTMGKERVKELISTFESESSSHLLAPMLTDRNDAYSVAFGSEWSGAKISDQNRMDLFEEATLASTRAHASWAKEMIDKLKADRKVASSVKPTGKARKARD